MEGKTGVISTTTVEDFETNRQGAQDKTYNEQHGLEMKKNYFSAVMR